MTDRQRRFQGPPPKSSGLIAFPRKASKRKFLYRAYEPRADRGEPRTPGYFAPRPPASGRFSVSAPRGTCYLAVTEAVAAAELIAPEFLDSGEVPWTSTRGWKVAKIVAPTITGLANVSNASVGPFGVTSELTSMDDYTIPQEWADAFDAAGFSGIFYTARFTPGGPNAIAWFKDAGRHDFDVDTERDLSAACRAAGYKIGLRPPTDIDSWDEATTPRAPQRRG